MSHRSRRRRSRSQSQASAIQLLAVSNVAIEALTGIVYSQPADTGSGQNTMTQLVYAVNHLKVGHVLQGDL